MKRYDVDGVHIDDYFYPYQEKDAAGEDRSRSPTTTPGRRTRRRAASSSRDDWRRDAVNRFVERMYDEVKAAKPWVKVGISPFGIWRPGNPPGIAGLRPVRRALRRREALAQRRLGRLLHAATLLADRPGEAELPEAAGVVGRPEHQEPAPVAGPLHQPRTGAGKGWPAREIVDQIEITRASAGAGGDVHFSMKAP